MKRSITKRIVDKWIQTLELEEKSRNTVEKYSRDIRTFMVYLNGKDLTRENVLAYKAYLIENYATRSVNSMLIAVNRLFCYLGWQDLKVKTLKLQRQVYCPEEKELTRNEYERLVLTARKNGNERLELILQTICGTGIRISELRYITVEAAKTGEAVVSLKGKTREVLIVKKLRNMLLDYAKRNRIKEGPVLVTRTGKPVCRTNIWREMKSLCSLAKVDPQKVFPHNLRHLFARIFYNINKDIAKLADILGHSNIETTRIYIVSSGVEHLRFLESMRLVI